MATSSVPAAIDYLVSTFQALPEVAGWIIEDGFTNRRGNQFLLLGIADDDGETGGLHQWEAIGNNAQTESYDIPCMIYVFSGGTSSKAVRDAAFVVFDAVCSAILADASFGGALKSGWGHVSAMRLAQTNAPEEAGGGRQVSLYFTVSCQSRLTV